MTMHGLFRYLKDLIFFYSIKRKFISIGRNVHIETALCITPENIKCGSNVTIIRNARIQAYMNKKEKADKPIIELRDGVYIGQNVYITCGGYISIGSNTCITANVSITDIFHPYEDINLPSGKQGNIPGKTTIGANCCIYNNVVVLPNVNIGNHCIIGANSVVTMDIPEYSVAVGSPAFIIKRYDFIRQEWRKTDRNGNFIK